MGWNKMGRDDRNTRTRIILKKEAVKQNKNLERRTDDKTRKKKGDRIV